MRYELKKLATVGMAILFFLCAAVNIGLFYQQQTLEQGELLADYPYYCSLLEQLQKDPKVLLSVPEDNNHGIAVYMAGQQQKHLQMYPDFIRTMPERAKAAANLSGGDAYSLRNIDKTTRDFAGLETLPLAADRDLGVAAVYRFPLSDMLLLVLVLVVCVKLFSPEYERKLFPLILATPSRLKIAAQKISVLFGVICLLAAVLYGGNLLISGLLYGFGDLSRPVQSISDFRTCARMLSCLDYLWVGFLIKLGSAVVFGLLVFMAFTLLKNAVTVFFAVTCFFGVSLGLYLGVGVTSSLNALHFVNAIHSMDSFSILSSYQNINFFGFPISMTAVLPVVFGILAIASVSVILLRFYSCVVCRAPKQIPALVRFFDWLKKNMDRLNHHGAIFLHELRKVMLGGKALFLIMALIFFMFYRYGTSYRLVDSATEEYTNYIRQIGGPITDETLGFLEQEWKFLAQVEEPDFYSGRKEALGLVESQVHMALQSAGERNLTPYLIDETGYLKLTDDRNADFFDCLFILAASILCCAGIFAKENIFGTKKLLRICKKGNNLFRYKILLSLAIPVVVAVVVNLTRFAIVAKDYALDHMDAPIQSVTALSGCRFSLTIFQYLLLLYAIRLLGALVTGSILSSVSSWCRSDSIAIAVSMGLLAAPVAAVFAGASILRYATVFPLLGGNDLLRDTLPGQIWCLLFAAACVAGSLLLAKRRWNKRT